MGLARLCTMSAMGGNRTLEGLSATPNHRRTIVTRTYPRNLSSALARRLGGPADAIPAIAALFVEIFLQMLRVR